MQVAQPGIFGLAIGASMMVAQTNVPDGMIDGIGKLSASAILGVICWWLIKRDREKDDAMQQQSKEFIAAMQSTISDNTRAIKSVEVTLKMCHEKASKMVGQY